MKALFDREGLLAAFQVVSSVVPTRSPKTVLLNVKLSVSEGGVALVATDLETVSISMDVRGVQVEKAGEALLPPSRMIQILRECGGQGVMIEADENSSTLRTEYSEFELPGEDPALYPEVAKFEGDSYYQVQAGVLRQLIDRTVFAAAQESAKYALTGVLWELSEEKVRLVGTDGRRLAVCDGIGLMHGKYAAQSQTPVVPTKAMLLLERNLVDPEDQVLVILRANEALFKTSRATIYGRLVEGRYPPYREVFPKRIQVKVLLPVGPFASVVRQAAIITDEESRGVDFSFAKGKVTLQSRVAEKGRARVEMPVAYDGKAIDITFDPRFLLDMLKVLDPGAEVQLEMQDSNSAAVFRLGDDYAYVVMPLARDGR